MAVSHCELSQGFQRVTIESLEGWRIMFIALGGVTIMFGLMVIILMPDNPMSVKWLSDVEKTVAIRRIAVNQTGIQNTHFKWSHLKELAFDVQIWLLVILTGFVSLRPSISLVLKSQHLCDIVPLHDQRSQSAPR